MFVAKEAASIVSYRIVEAETDRHIWRNWLDFPWTWKAENKEQLSLKKIKLFVDHALFSAAA